MYLPVSGQQRWNQGNLNVPAYSGWCHNCIHPLALFSHSFCNTESSTLLERPAPSLPLLLWPCSVSKEESPCLHVPQPEDYSIPRYCSMSLLPCIPKLLIYPYLNIDTGIFQTPILFDIDLSGPFLK